MSVLNDIDFIKNIDKSNMHHLITHMPEQIYIMYNTVISPNLKNNHFDNIIFYGMGGSAIAADLISAFFANYISCKVIKWSTFTPLSEGGHAFPPLSEGGHTFPPLSEGGRGESHPNILHVFISYSGNTAEVIDSYKNTIPTSDNIVTITSGGKLKEISEKNNFHINLPANYPPRAAIALMFFSIIKLLEALNIIPSQEKIVNALIGNLMQKAGCLCYKTELNKNLAKSTAESIFPKIPVIYSSCPVLLPVAYRWKCQINENAKMPAFFHTIPEMCHNEVEAWELPIYTQMFIPVFLRSFNENKGYSETVRAFQDLLNMKHIEFLEFYGDGLVENFTLQDIFTLIYLGDMISFYLAILNKVDPTEIKNITYIKSKEKKNYE